jgi:diguanylate cyclase (GGDEF)-like protein
MYDSATELDKDAANIAADDGSIWSVMSHHKRTPCDVEADVTRVHPQFDSVLLAEALRISRIGCWEYATSTGTMVWSREMFTLLGFEPSMTVPTYEEMLAHVQPRDSRRHWAYLQRSLRDGKSYDFDIRLRPEFTQITWLNVVVQPVVDADGAVKSLFGVAFDISERKAAEEKTAEYAALLEHNMGELQRANERLAALATTDGLTGITNHRAFYERLGDEHQRSRRSEEPISVILLDVDRFKNYNDSFGHPAGDSVLKGVASLLVECVRATDVVARYGGEEFVVMLPETSLDSAVTIAERCRRAVETADWGHRTVTASFGIATSTPGMSVDDLISSADRALYAAKSAGRNLVRVA